MSERRSGEARVAAATSNPNPKKRNPRSPVLPTGKGKKPSFVSTIDECAVYDQFGPGFVGTYLDGVADDVAALTPIPEFRSAANAKFQPINAGTDDNTDPSGPWAEQVLAACHEALLEWRSMSDSTHDLVWAHARLLTARAAAWIWDDPWTRDENTPRHGFRVVSPAEANVTKSGLWVWDSPHGQVQIPIPTDGLWMSYTPHPDSGAPYTELVRAAVHIREYISAKGRQQSDADTSKIPDMVWLGADTDQTAGNPVPSDEYDEDDAVLDVVRDLAEIVNSKAQRRYHDPADHLPPMPMTGTVEPKLVKLLREIDAGAFDLEDRSLNAVARALRIPVKLLVEGPGNAKYDNESLLYKGWVSQAVAPRARVVYSDWTKMWFWPRVLELLGEAGVKSLPKGFQARLGYNLEELTPEDDSIASLKAAVQLGATPARTLADALKIPHLKLPDDMTDFDLWKVLVGSTNDQQQGRIPNEPPSGKTASATVIDAPPAPVELAAPEYVPAAFQVMATVKASLTMMLSATQRECERRLTRSLNSGGRNVTEETRARVRDATRARIQDLPDIYAKWAAITTEERERYDLAPEVLITAASAVAVTDMRCLLADECSSFSDFDVDAAVTTAQQVVERLVHQGFIDGPGVAKVTDGASRVVMIALSGKVLT